MSTCRKNLCIMRKIYNLHSKLCKCACNQNMQQLITKHKCTLYSWQAKYSVHKLEHNLHKPLPQLFDSKCDCRRCHHHTNCQIVFITAWKEKGNFK